MPNTRIFKEEGFKMRKIFVFLFILFFAQQVYAQPQFNSKLPVPGKTIADVQLQKDTLVAAYAAAAVFVKNSNYISVVNTKVTQSPRNLKKKNGKIIGGDWGELWTIACDEKKVDVPIIFILDETGCSYVINNSGVKFSE